MQATFDPLLFALGNLGLANAIAARLGVTLATLEERPFGGGEHKVRPLDDVTGRDVYVVDCLNGEPGRSANDKLVRLLFFVGALKDAGAGRVTAVTPYLAYTRKDRRTKMRDPVSTRYVAQLFESVGTDRIVTVEVHNVAAFENAFRHCRPEHLPIAGLLAEHFAVALAESEIAVVSPDAGGAKRAELFRHCLERRLARPVARAIMEKHRSMGLVTGSLFAGDVAGRTAIIVDDLISSGTTIMRTADACRKAGATRVIAAAAHAMFGRECVLLGPDGPDAVVVTDTIALADEVAAPGTGRMEVVSIAGLLGDVVGRLNRNEPVSELIPYD
jgi:ribose-phosphate pyrophosphokinase